MKTFNPDDPMLTAYAFGELEGEELREVEALLARDPAAMRHVEAIRAAAAGFTEALEREAAPAVEPIRPIEIEPPQRRAPIIPFLFYATTAAAACFFVILVVRLADPATLDDRKNRTADAVVPAAIDVIKQDVPDEGRAQSLESKEEMETKGTSEKAMESRAFRVAPSTAVRDIAEPAPPEAPFPRDDWPDKNEVGRRDAGTKPMAKRASEDADSKDRLSVVGQVNFAGSVKRQVDSNALLAELGFSGLRAEPVGADEALESQLSVAASHQPDPEAALLRAVEGFARLVAEEVPASDEAWDRVLADARYAAGDDPKRINFVATIEKARAIAAKYAR